MPYYFDNWGWLTDEVLPGRSTDVVPPDPATIPEGKRANFTGHKWVVLQYVPPVEVRPVAQSVTRQQMKRALHRLGLLPAITSYVGTSGDPELEIWFNDSQAFERGNTTLNEHLPVLGITSEQADDIFNFAASL